MAAVGVRHLPASQWCPAVSRIRLLRFAPTRPTYPLLCTPSVRHRRAELQCSLRQPKPTPPTDAFVSRRSPTAACRDTRFTRVTNTRFTWWTFASTSCRCLDDPERVSLVFHEAHGSRFSQQHGGRCFVTYLAIGTPGRSNRPSPRSACSVSIATALRCLSKT